MKQLKESPETLSKMELYAFSVIIREETEPKKSHEESPKELEYDPLNPILYGNDRQIRETLTNLLYGEFIHQVLELPEMKPIKARQKAAGLIANVDKPIIISAVQSAMIDSLEQTAQVIEQRFVPIKFNILLGKNESVFQEYLKFNTNISVQEIFELEKKEWCREK